VLSVTL